MPPMLARDKKAIIQHNDMYIYNPNEPSSPIHLSRLLRATSLIWECQAPQSPQASVVEGVSAFISLTNEAAQPLRTNITNRYDLEDTEKPSKSSDLAQS